MGIDTCVKVKGKSICFDHLCVESMYDLTSQMDEGYDTIKKCFEELGQLAVATPKDISPIPNDQEDVWAPFEYVRHRVQDLVEEINEEQGKLYKLWALKYILEDYTYGKDRVNLEDPDQFKKIVTVG